MPSINDSRCILVIGATAGIGRSLALAIYGLPTKPTVIVAGRRRERLDELVKQGDGRIAAMQVDISAGNEALKEFVQEVVSKYPEVSDRVAQHARSIGTRLTSGYGFLGRFCVVCCWYTTCCRF